MSLINPYKLLVVDIDGTLLDKNGALSAEDKDAIARVSNSGIQVSLSTGRVVKASLKVIKELSLDGYHMFFDGALVVAPEDNKEIYAQPISAELVGRMVEFSRLNEINIEFFSVTHYFVERESWASDIRRRFFGIEPTITDFNKLWQRERIIKGTMVISSPEERAKTDAFSLHFNSSLGFSWTKTPAYPEVDFINVLAPDVSKGKAVEELARYMGVALTDVMAIGDGANDISLLSKAALSVAMGNATDELKAVADYVTLDIGHHGVAAAVNRFLL
ncbi:Cof-type HAD-IIB family hydrolase [Chloroflexota bacterium]